MNKKTLLEKFRDFYFRNYPDDMEQQIELFSFFGGLDLDIDSSKPAEVLLREIFIDNFEFYDKKIEALIDADKLKERLLKALAIGDRRIFSAFKRAGLNNGNGGATLKELQELNIVSVEYSREEPPEPKKNRKRSEARHRISHKVVFENPFLRFWFYFISPHKREIVAGEYENFFKNFAQKRHSYTSFIFEELSAILLNYNIRNAQLLSSGSYWDAKVEIDIFTITDRDEIYVGECKWTNHKINKKEYHKLLEKCEQLELNPKQVLFFSKRGFSKELLSMVGKDLALFSSEEFSMLLKSH
jgi:hypothetical protein